MTVINQIIKLVIIAFMMYSCVPAKEYYKIEAANSKYLKQIKSDSTKLSKLTEVNGTQLMKIFSLSEDSIRLYYSFDSLQTLYKKTSQIGYMQLANIRRELDNKDLEVTHIEQESKAILYTLTSYDVEANAIYRQLSRYIQRYSGYGAKINKSYWNVTVSLPDNMIFCNVNHGQLSPAGKSVISAIINLMKQHPKYHIDIVEFSRPEVKKFFKDTVITYKVIDTLYQNTPNPDTLGITKRVPIQYSYEGFRIDKKQISQEMPAAMTRGTAIIKYIESLGSKAKGVSYNGTIYTYKPKQIYEPDLKNNIIEIIINPKTSSILRDIGAF